MVGLESSLVKEKVRQSWLWTPRRRKQWSTLLKRRFWKQNFFMDTRIRLRLVRIRQQWIEDARLNHSLNKYFLNTSLTKTCQPLCLDDNKKDRTTYHGLSQVFLIFFLGHKSVENIPYISAIGRIFHEEWTDAGKPSSLFHTWKSCLKHYQLKDFAIFAEIAEITVFDGHPSISSNTWHN